MKMKATVTLVATSFALILAAPQTAKANDQSYDEKVQEAKSFYQEVHNEAKSVLDNLESDSTKEDILQSLEPVFEGREVPDVIENSEVDPDDVFPEWAIEYDNLETLNLNEEFAKHDANTGFKGYSDHATTYNFSESDSQSPFSTQNENEDKVEILLYESGEMILLEHETIQNNDGDISTQALTPTRRTNASVSNSVGGLEFLTFFAEGQFNYTGSSVSVANGDGDYNRTIAGSALDVTPRGMGAGRTYTEQGYQYAEVYTRLYIESSVPLRFVGIVFRSQTVETYVGSTVNGNIYGGTGVVQ